MPALAHAYFRCERNLRGSDVAWRDTSLGSCVTRNRPAAVIVVFSRARRVHVECSVDDRRWQWTTYANLNTWFDGWKAFLLHHGFAEDTPEEQPDGKIAEVTIPPQKMRRILNADETHHTLDNEGDRGGSRARSYVGRNRSRSGQRHVKAAGHVTGLYTTTASGQNGPSFYMFSTSAEDPENYQVKSP